MDDKRILCPACGGSGHIIESVSLEEPIDCPICTDGTVTKETAAEWERYEAAYWKEQEP